MPISTTSPGCRYRGGFAPWPTPAGVPVEIASPARSDMKRLTYAISAATEKIILPVLPSCPLHC
jgi:hypothetical protein